MNSTQIVGIMQGEWGIVSASNEKRILTTPAVGPCIAVTFHLSKLNIAGLAHVDDKRCTKFIGDIFQHFKENFCIQPQEFDVQVIGGWNTRPFTKELGSAILTEIKKYNVVPTARLYEKTVSLNFLSKGTQNNFDYKNHYWAAISIDPLNGKVVTSDNFKIPNSAYGNTKQYNKRLKRRNDRVGHHRRIVKAVDKTSPYILTLTKNSSEKT